MNVEEFIKELKPMITTKHSPYHNRDVHYMGSTILTNKELNRMLEVMLKDDYTQLIGMRKKEIRQRIFREITDE